ncbi:hypothetical protein PanWU01x14_106430 [Parasponia andersonii]|uniref:Uncharacterized protein n=1 Tax=Parasponia andersonii TaxID=3476 RepID=A0A2P5D0R9_PARAD|nr:hypothetical protein PanWU01x14_106430 [Parasponia andersonii]
MEGEPIEWQVYSTGQPTQRLLNLYLKFDSRSLGKRNKNGFSDKNCFCSRSLRYGNIVTDFEDMLPDSQQLRSTGS